MNAVIQTRSRTIPLSHRELVVALQSIATERLTQKQKRILIVIDSLDEDLPVTRVVGQLADLLQCSESAIWNNLNQLKNIGLVTSGDIKTKGRPVGITALGRLLVRHLRQEE